MEHALASIRDIRIELRDFRKSVDQQFVDLRRVVDQQRYFLLAAFAGLAGLIAKGFHWF